MSNMMYPSGNPYDTTASYQQRLNNMMQQYNQQQPVQQNYAPQYIPMQQQQYANPYSQQQAAPHQFVNVHAIASYDEVVSSQIPLDGSVSVFTDFSHGKIYTKQLNMNDGTALIRTYAIADGPAPTMSEPVKYVEQSEFDELKNRFNEVWKALTEKNPAPQTEQNNETKKGGNK